MNTGIPHHLGLPPKGLGRLEKVITNIGMRNVLLVMPLKERVGGPYLCPFREALPMPSIILRYWMKLGKIVGQHLDITVDDR